MRQPPVTLPKGLHTALTRLNWPLAKLFRLLPNIPQTQHCHSKKPEIQRLWCHSQPPFRSDSVSCPRHLHLPGDYFVVQARPTRRFWHSTRRLQHIRKMFSVSRKCLGKLFRYHINYFRQCTVFKNALPKREMHPFLNLALPCCFNICFMWLKK